MDRPPFFLFLLVLASHWILSMFLCDCMVVGRGDGPRQEARWMLATYRDADSRSCMPWLDAESAVFGSDRPTGGNRAGWLRRPCQSVQITLCHPHGSCLWANQNTMILLVWGCTYAWPTRGVSHLISTPVFASVPVQRSSGRGHMRMTPLPNQAQLGRLSVVSLITANTTAPTPGRCSKPSQALPSQDWRAWERKQEPKSTAMRTFEPAWQPPCQFPTGSTVHRRRPVGCGAQP
ncbi:hypothetical protein GGTG_02053 [Gaeumannomyces tritici R3-111a-1]|uniref:Uncharacterized protein n=1 Tax=Gaeumannomyces tritici (strain R3-111a-1) TaxID=644352 RepID=J3NLA5_GAET3|nr:hypothetical protein GGTG_02053 [Gaeumannomyces tritici R3-111a-1]EJT82079.1 hypothetical protein GGTG_02053 [Gaeumannomyces tritici R3-111a-1]